MTSPGTGKGMREDGFQKAKGSLQGKAKALKPLLQVLVSSRNQLQPFPHLAGL